MRMLSSPVNVFLMIRFSGANSDKEGALPVIVFTLPHKKKNSIPGVFCSVEAFSTPLEAAFEGRVLSRGEIEDMNRLFTLLHEMELIF
jgi:hypothetical protein